jgi:hypothetical protein
MNCNPHAAHPASIRPFSAEPLPHTAPAPLSSSPLPAFFPPPGSFSPSHTFEGDSRMLALQRPIASPMDLTVSSAPGSRQNKANCMAGEGGGQREAAERKKSGQGASLTPLILHISSTSSQNRDRQMQTSKATSVLSRRHRAPAWRGWPGKLLAWRRRWTGAPAGHSLGRRLPPLQRSTGHLVQRAAFPLTSAYVWAGV